MTDENLTVCCWPDDEVATGYNKKRSNKQKIERMERTGEERLSS